MTRTKIADYLLEIKAVRIRVQDPFTWSSGWRSPIYCDNRLILSYPQIRTEVRDAFVEKIREVYPGCTAIAGVATGAIAMGALVADAMGLPFVYVREKPKGHGMQNQVEGRAETEWSYVVIEDLISTGKSSVNAVQAMQSAGLNVLGALAIFSYGFPQAKAAFDAVNTPFDTLTGFDALLPLCITRNLIQPEEISAIEAWQQQPDAWMV